MSPIGDLARQDEYDLPDVGLPMLSPGPQFSPGLPAVNNAIGSLFAPRPRDENSPVRYRTASPLVNISEQDIKDATEAAMASSGGGLGIKAYHSSPHDFDKFDLSKIGTGEGAQIYGHGLYFAENPAVSGRGGQYWKQFANRGSSGENTATEYLARAGFDREKAAQTVRDLLANPPVYTSGYNKMTQERMRQEALQLLESDKHIGPRTYEVDINADPAHFLDWDTSLPRQAAPVKSTLEAMGIRQQMPNASGNAIYDALMNRGFITEGTSKLAQRASETLREAGIPGIKYLDQQSRFSQALYNDNPIANAARQFVEAAGGNAEKAGKLFYESNPAQHWAVPERDEIHRLIQMAGNKPTSNYVVFNPGLIDIRRKYGIPAAAATGAMGALAAQDQYNHP